jgi:hypothetical protein
LSGDLTALTHPARPKLSGGHLTSEDYAFTDTHRFSEKGFTIFFDVTVCVCENAFSASILNM